MLLVKTKVKKSDIHGVGLFADEFIPKGTRVWEFTPKFDIEFNMREAFSFSTFAMKYLMKYSYKSYKNGKYILCFDDTKYINHSNNPNMAEMIDFEGEAPDYALRDIELGEELTLDYTIIDSDYRSKLEDDIWLKKIS